MESLLPSPHAGQGVHLENQDKPLKTQGLRRKREFTPEEKKDTLYWEKRRKNNAAAKRSRERRKVNDYMLESHLVALSEENMRLSTELLALRRHFSLVGPAGQAEQLSSQLRLHRQAPQRPQSVSSHQPLESDSYWGRSLSPLPKYQHQTSVQPLHSLPSFLSGHVFDGSGLPSSFLLPMHLPGALSSWPKVSPLRPLPQRITFDEEEEQQVLGSLSCTVLPRSVRLESSSRAPPVHKVGEIPSLHWRGNTERKSLNRPPIGCIPNTELQ